MKYNTALSALTALATTALAVPAPAPRPLAAPRPDGTIEERAEATVSLDSGSVVGSSLLGIESFKGIPFADPPVGSLRLKPPQRYSGDLDAFDATGTAAACPQMFVSSESKDLLGNVLDTLLDLPLLNSLTGQEDCLTIDVQRPAGTQAGDGLPVLFWIFGGGFELGSTSMYDGSSLLGTAMDQDQPFVFVAVNYRVAGFGFMPGAEILADGSANLGLLDQRMGLEWVADNIASFGGDPDKVTIWGESAGSISVFNQLALYGGNATYKDKPLFRAGIMNSGSAVPADPVDCPKAQAVYDTVVDNAGCAGADDSLQCLRDLDYDAFLEASNGVPGILSYSSVALSYLPRPDGTALPDSPDVLGIEGRYYAVPFIIGDQEDEGTLFALFQSNLTSTEDVVAYLQDLFFSSATTDQLNTLLETYEPPVTANSPFRTGGLNELYSGYKRLAAVLGDLVFTLTRRVLLDIATQNDPDLPAWSYLASYDYGTPVMGTFHGSDLLQVFYGVLPNHAMRSIRTYYFNFLHNLDPNEGVGGYANWPQWKENRSLMWFESADENSILADDFRSDSYDWIKDNVDILHF